MGFTPIDPAMRQRYRRQIASPLPGRRAAYSTETQTAALRRRHRPRSQSSPHSNKAKIGMRDRKNKTLARTSQCRGFANVCYADIRTPTCRTFSIGKSHSFNEWNENAAAAAAAAASVFNARGRSCQLERIYPALLYLFPLLRSISALLIGAQEVVGSASELLSTISLHHQQH